MNRYVAEAVGTMILILLDDGGVANVLLARSKGQNSGWIVITVGWAWPSQSRCTPWDVSAARILAPIVGGIAGAALYTFVGF